MSEEWYYTTGGQQAGPVNWETLLQMAAQGKLNRNDHVWNASMSGWVAASSVPGLIPAPRVPPLPPPLPPAIASTGLVAKARKVSGEVVLVGFGGGVLPGMMTKVEVKLAGTNLGSGTLQGGFRLPFQAAVGTHTVELIVAGGMLTSLLGGFGKKIEASASGRTYPVEFPTAGHYLVTLTPSGVKGMPPSGVEVKLAEEAPQQLALSPVAEDEPEEGLVQRGFAAIGHGLKAMQESSRRSQLHGLWESVGGEGHWFMFTKDGAMLRGDGFGAKFRWPDDDSVEVYEIGCEATARFQILSLGKHELLLKAGPQTGHFRRGETISEAEEGRRREEARRRMAELRQQTISTLGSVAAILAAGGLAVLCGAAAVTGDSGGASGSAGPAFTQQPCGQCNQRGWNPSSRGDGSQIVCNICGGKGFMLRKGG